MLQVQQPGPTRRGARAGRPRPVKGIANVRSISAQSISAASLTNEQRMLICSSSRRRYNSAVRGCEGFGPIESPEKFARKQVLAEPQLANPAPINSRNR